MRVVMSTGAAGSGGTGGTSGTGGLLKTALPVRQVTIHPAKGGIASTGSRL